MTQKTNTKNAITIIIGICICITLMTNCAVAQWTTSGSTTYTDKTVGIGTTTPKSTLQVAGDVRVGNNSAYTDIKLFTDVPQAGYNSTFSLMPVTIPGSGMAKHLTWFKNNADGSPGSTRHDVKIDGMLTIGNYTIGTHPATNAYNLQITGDGNAYPIAGILLKNGNGLPVTFGFSSNKDISNVEIWNYNSGYIRIATGNIERLRIDNAGNIGIGTISPTEKLTVNGNIKAKKIIATQNGWADYVFDKNYKLMSLDDLSIYIEQHKHLPEIPTTKEVEKEGVDVGTNQALLLKKVEELTLYIIQQQQEIKALKKEIQKRN